MSHCRLLFQGIHFVVTQNMLIKVQRVEHWRLFKNRRKIVNWHCWARWRPTWHGSTCDKTRSHVCCVEVLFNLKNIILFLCMSMPLSIYSVKKKKRDKSDFTWSRVATGKMTPNIDFTNNNMQIYINTIVDMDFCLFSLLMTLKLAILSLFYQSFENVINTHLCVKKWPSYTKQLKYIWTIWYLFLVVLPSTMPR